MKKVTPLTPLYVLPYQCDSPILMRFFYAKNEGIARAYRITRIEDYNLRWKMAYILDAGRRKVDNVPEAEE